jgi:hypothetical protein
VSSRILCRCYPRLLASALIGKSVGPSRLKTRSQESKPQSLLCYPYLVLSLHIRVLGNFLLVTLGICEWMLMLVFQVIPPPPGPPPSQWAQRPPMIPGFDLKPVTVSHARAPCLLGDLPQINRPPAVKSIFNIFSLVNFNFELLAPECSVSLNFEAKWWVTIGCLWMLVTVGVVVTSSLCLHHALSAFVHMSSTCRIRIHTILWSYGTGALQAALGRSSYSEAAPHAMRAMRLLWHAGTSSSHSPSCCLGVWPWPW